MKLPKILLAVALLGGLLLAGRSAQAQDAPGVIPALGPASVTATPVKDAPNPGYDRPGAGNRQTDGHQHVVYWSDYFDRYFPYSPQAAADASNVDEIFKPRQDKK